MKANYAVMETKTGVILIEGTYEFCANWMIYNCKHNKKYGIWKDVDHKQVEIIQT